MFFASDMPGGFGGVDLYKSQADENGNWSVPVNLGNTINTEGDEMFPFFEDDKQTLSFASNGHFGLGGLDVFSSVFNGQVWGEVTNLGAPLNSQYDDFSFIFNSKTNKGYFSSNRLNSLGDDDIYSIERFNEIEKKKLIAGIANDKNGNPISEALVSLYDSKDSLLAYVISDIEGTFKFIVNKDKEFLITGTKEKFIKGSTQASSFGLQDTIFVSLVLLQDETNAVPIDNGLTKMAKLNAIHFDFDKSEIRKDAAEELDKIVKTMNDFPEMEIQLSAFADCRGTLEYNAALSNDRASATTNYIKNRIANPARVSGKGYGESRSTNGCVCDENGYSECSETSHQENRRTEFTITK
jgi:outer membrane protein OmpA-like peptidoglycan-associated protein